MDLKQKIFFVERTLLHYTITFVFVHLTMDIYFFVFIKPI